MNIRRNLNFVIDWRYGLLKTIDGYQKTNGNKQFKKENEDASTRGKVKLEYSNQAEEDISSTYNFKMAFFHNNTRN